jgi:hypothetical protein
MKTLLYLAADEEEAASYLGENVHYIIIIRIRMSLTSSLVGFWIHLDVDVLDEVIMPPWIII